MNSVIHGVELIENYFISDERGFTSKTYDAFLKDLSIDQVLLSHNLVAGTVRGMHYQVSPHVESKVVTCLSGEIIDFVLDLRPDSPSFMQTAQFHLSSPRVSIFIPEMVAHGYQTLENNSTIQYLISGKHCKKDSRVVNIFDPKLDLRLPLAPSVISQRDRDSPFI